MKKLIIALAVILFAGMAYGQSLQKGGILAIHEWSLTLNPDVTMDQFVKFWETKAIPLMKQQIPEATSFIIKGIRENNKDTYAGLYVYNSLEDLRKYWKEDGSPTEKGMKAMESYGPIMEEIATFGEFTYTASDWIIVK